MSDLDSLRSDVLILTLDILENLKLRSEKAKQIQKMKADTGKSSFSPKYEFTLFQKFTQLNENHELMFLLTLIMEEQGLADYPKFSKAQHLKHQAFKKVHQINPIMLKLWSPREFEQLELNNNFDFIRDL